MPENHSTPPTQPEIAAAIARGRPADLVAIVHAILCAPVPTSDEAWMSGVHRSAVAAIEAARPDLRAEGGR